MKLSRLPDGRFALESSYSPKLVEALKSVPGLRWDPEDRVWVGYQDAFKEAVEDATLQCDRGYLEQVFNSLPDEVFTDLRGYQQEGVQFLVAKASVGCILADVMGAGKTAQAIRAAKALGGKTLVVCPSFVCGVWNREVDKWGGGWAVGRALEGLSGDPIPDDYTVVICHYELLSARLKDILAWGPATVIFDECHYLGNERSQRSQAAKEIAKSCKYRIGLSGTPMTNRPKDLWNVVDTLSPGRFGSFFSYAKRYCGAAQKDIRIGQDIKTVWDFSGKSNVEELRRRLSYFMLRRTHDDIKLELPPRVRQTIELRVPAKNRVGVTGDMKPEAMHRALALAADGKLKEVFSLINQHLEDGRKVVAFCYRRAVAELLAKECDGLAISGDYTQKQRDERIEVCRAAGEPCLLAATIDVASVGIDLTFADVVVFVELTYVPTELAQAESRVYRFGQGKPVLIQYVIALGTVDELIQQQVIGKLDTQEGLGLTDGEFKRDLRNEEAEDEALRGLLEGL